MKLRDAASGVLVAVVTLLPLGAHADTLTDIQSRIATMLTQITDLKAQILQLQSLQYPGTTSATTTAAVNALIQSVTPAVTTFLQSIGTSSTTPTAPSIIGNATTICPTLARSLALGARGSDVSSLQQFLVSLGLLTPDSVSGYFGSLTQVAVQKWQAQSGIVSSGSPTTTGWGAIGVRTKAAIIASCGGSAAPQNDTISVGAQGLSVEARLTVNTRGSCSALSYTLDWGDGASQTFSIPSGSCVPMKQSFYHTYSAAGSQTATLISNTYRISAPMTLYAPLTCTPPAFATDTVPGGVTGQWYTLPIFASLDPSGLSVSATGQPGGLLVAKSIMVNASTSATTYLWSLSGTPTTTGTYSVSFTGQNSCGKSSRTISLPITDRSSLCAAPPTPACTGGTLQPLGNDANGCSLGYACINPTTTVVPVCPAVMPPQCIDGSLVSNGFDVNGCSLGYKCVPHTSTGTFTASPTSGSAPLYVTFSTNINTGFTADKYKIDFGDGTSAEPASCYAPTDACATPGKTPHTYASSGTYTALLKKYVGSHCGWNAQPSDALCQSMDTVTTLGTVTITAGGNFSCAADVSAASASLSTNQICGQGGVQMRCPYDSNYTTQTLDTCTTIFLQHRGWTAPPISASASSNLANALTALQAALEGLLGR